MPKRDVWVCLGPVTVNADTIRTIEHPPGTNTVEIAVTGRRTPLAVRSGDPAASCRNLLEAIARCAEQGGHWILTPDDRVHGVTWSREALGTGSLRAATRLPGAPPDVVPDSWRIPEGTTGVRHASDPAQGHPTDTSGT
jgi:hypothetical protein